MVKAAHKIILGYYLVISKLWSSFFRSLLVLLGHKIGGAVDLAGPVVS
jgi:hypothetical protein